MGLFSILSPNHEQELALIEAKRKKAYLDYIDEIERVQKNELLSKKYQDIASFMKNNYYNKESLDKEEELFKLVGSCSLEDSLLQADFQSAKDSRLARYIKLEELINSLDEKDINSNIYLKTAQTALNLDINYFNDTITRISNKEENGYNDKLISLELPIYNNIKEIIPNYISTTAKVKYHTPSEFEYEYIDALDENHQYLYNDYHKYVITTTFIVEDILKLRLNAILYDTDISCDYLKIYHPGYKDCINITFSIFREKVKPEEEKTTYPTDEYINATISNFKKLLDMGLVSLDDLKDEKEKTYTK